MIPRGFGKSNKNAKFSFFFNLQVALATEIPDYNQMTLPLGGGHTATAAQMRHFCRSYEFQLPPQPSMSPPLPPLSTVQFSTLGPGGRHVYCNIPMTLLNGQVGGKPGLPLCFFIYCLFLLSNNCKVHPFLEFGCLFACSRLNKIKNPSFLPRGSKQFTGEQEVCLDDRI